ncbi:hypothetical protein SKAU_G00088950 [Synaphobranchus kaupii]|uniref:Uncharacterized protein n=1 Tax=Synaphobranchus kaupii TaxID=118154 RepID=A0A9Q1J577_SYNKA|nr:hypothetical protein SKAU_G00088950 [Synaphobranchus kaupii]
MWAGFQGGAAGGIWSDAGGVAGIQRNVSWADKLALPEQAGTGWGGGGTAGRSLRPGGGELCALPDYIGFSVLQHSSGRQRALVSAQPTPL